MKKLLMGNKITHDVLSAPITVQHWKPIWLTFAAYALVVAILFALLFRHQHNPEEIGEIKH